MEPRYNFSDMSKEVRRSTDLLKNLEGRLESVTEGRFARHFRDGEGNLLKSGLELAVARLLKFFDIKYTYGAEIPLGNESVRVDFLTDHGLIEVCEGPNSWAEASKKVARIRRTRPETKAVVVANTGQTFDPIELGVPVVAMNPAPDLDPRKETIFMDDPSFAFDYSHILPWTEKCSVLHGHTSAVLVEIMGTPRRGMIVDFGEAKHIIREALRTMDHKLFISRKYMVEETASNYRLKFTSPNGEFDLSVPKVSTFLMGDEATIENLADVVSKMLIPKMPENVEAIGVYIYEGFNKGSHLLASILHSKAE